MWARLQRSRPYFVRVRGKERGSVTGANLLQGGGGGDVEHGVVRRGFGVGEAVGRRLAMRSLGIHWCGVSVQLCLSQITVGSMNLSVEIEDAVLVGLDFESVSAKP